MLYLITMWFKDFSWPLMKLFQIKKMHWLESIALMALTEQATSFADTSSKNWIGILKRPLMNSKYTVGILLNVKTTLMISKKENGPLPSNNQIEKEEENCPK